MPLLPSLRSEKFDQVAMPLLESGRYKSADEVLDAALDALMREECGDEAKQVWLDQALADGDASGIYEGDVFAEIREHLGLPQRVRA